MMINAVAPKFGVVKVVKTMKTQAISDKHLPFSRSSSPHFVFAGTTPDDEDALKKLAGKPPLSAETKEVYGSPITLENFLKLTP